MCDCYKEIQHLQVLLSIEKTKNHIYKQIIEKTLDMKLTDRTDEILNEIVFKKIKKKSPEQYNQIIQHSPIRNQTFSKPVDVDEKKKKIYKNVPKTLEITEEPSPESIHDNIKIKEVFLSEEIKQIFGEFDIDICKDEIKNSFDSIKDSRNYTQVLTHIKNNRTYLQTVLSPDEYVSLLKEHMSKVRVIFSDKSFNDKKIHQTIFPKFFSALEYRLIKVEGFEKQNIEMEDISKFKISQKISANYPKTFRVFDNSVFYKYFLNYSIALNSVSELFEKYINNPYGFKNIIYLPVSDDVFSFYTLVKIENNKRFWKMDCRLETITNELSETVKNYCIALFRSIYKGCFNTNNFIIEYKSKYQVLEFDCEQILQNLFLCIHFFKINDILKNIVKDICTYSATSNDKFDLYSDDKEQLQNFKHHSIEQSDFLDIVKQLFDNIEDSTAKEFYSKYV
jgi:hypothetical protein